MNEALRKTLKQLHLSGLLENLESCLQEAASHGLDHAEFLELSVQDELAVRGNRKLESPRRSGECLFEVVMRQYETWSTMMTSNRPLEDWDKLLGDAPGASAILDRFLHHAELVQATGPSYRLRYYGGLSSDKAQDSKPANAPPGSVGR
jgi:IstB-like ATP binding protein